MDEKIFRNQEILKLAIQIEINGFEFYKEAANLIKDPLVCEVFNYLASEEKKHQETFNSLLEQVGDYQLFENYPGEYDLFLRDLAGENIFTKVGTSTIYVSKIASRESAIKMAIGFERDTIIFFTEMKNLLPQQTHDTINKLLAEETKHLAKLKELENKAK